DALASRVHRSSNRNRLSVRRNGGKISHAPQGYICPRMQTLRSQKARGISAMSERIYITETGERVRERDGHIDVGLSAEAQAALGDLLHFQPPKIGAWINAGERLFVIEGTRSAAEFYAPDSGRVVSCAAASADIAGWFVLMKVVRTF
ncbi:glycine cleavage system protein H, partial [Roseitranquillus sediminis]|uniref:hypothetical protein n=1 Tax=Roseitranquillus sediminis TaxID=2809051 RepID=UPI001D0CBEB3